MGHEIVKGNAVALFDGFNVNNFDNLDGIVVELLCNSLFELGLVINGRGDHASHVASFGGVFVKAKSRDSVKIKAVLEANASRPVPTWLDLNRENCEAKIVNLPEREQINAPVEEHLIVEFYSK